MQNSAEPVYSASSPPFVLDSDMSGRLDSDPDFEFFDSNLPLESANSPGIFLAQDFATETSEYLNFASPIARKSPLPNQALLDTKLEGSLSAPSTASPAGSYQDSSSDSSGYKRKSSSESSRSALTSADVMMADDADLGDWKMEDMIGGNDMSSFGTYDGTINPASINNNFEFNDKSMENDFDFDSAASSPSPFGRGPTDSPEMPTIKHNTPRKNSPGLKVKPNKSHNKANSQHSMTQSMNGLTTSGSREASPLSAMVTSQENSPAAFFNASPSPATGMEFVIGAMPFSAGPNSAWPTGYQSYSNIGRPAIPQGLNHQPMPRMAPQGYPQMGAPFKPVLTLHPTPLKSRVETLIPIKMTLFPMPIGITKLHLPTHTISKPKLLAKPAAERSPDTLELYTTLVCTSAMQNPENRRRAFERAALGLGATESTPDESLAEEEAAEDDENRPLNGGDVKICPGCITRERKRAARKKVKKVEEEESWHKDEAKRVIVFNTHEIKDWQAPTSQPPSDITGDRAEPFIPDGALQVDAPMRIACYCRHQAEKLGFQVIFTIKDHQDRLVAQEMTSSIMITDDHKTHNIPPLTTQGSSESEGQMYSASGSFPSEATFEMHNGPAGTMGAFRLSHSSSDLQGMQRASNMQQPSMSLGTSPQPSQTTSATMTPRNLSRQTSPTAFSGPTSKKRKASTSGKVPTGLAMTRLETSQPGSIPPPASLSATSVTSPFTSNLQNFPLPTEQHFGQSSTTMPPVPQQYNTGPPTPNSNNDQLFFSNHNRSQSMENLAMAQQMYSAPTSAHPSRAPSPNGMRSSVHAYQQQQAQIAQAVANGLYGIPLSLNPHRPPTIHKLIPNEGPKAGGIEVTCLGSGFCQGLEVMFGDCKATTTTYWGETSLVCLLPPSAFPGTVPVTFKHQYQQQQMQPYPSPPMPKQQAFFKYVDDDEQQIIRTALSVLGHKMTGKMEDVRDLARRIVGDGPSSWGASAGHSPSGGSSNQQVSGFNAATFGIDVEATLLRCLDLIDLDDSPNMPRLNLRRASGQTMLHLACSLGLHRFVAALLARGANPEPRDKGGFTPMHFAALHGHPQIVRRLMLSGADPTVRSLQGYTPSDMATSEEVLRIVRRIEHHTRTRSGSSLRSRTSSATSLRSLWEPASTPGLDHALDEDSDDGDNEYEDEDADAANDGAFWMRSRRPSAQKSTKKEVDAEKDPILELPGVPAGLASPTATMTAFRDHIGAHWEQIQQQIQQSMHLNLPNLPQMPRLDLPDYQAYLPTAPPMLRRMMTGINRPEGSEEQHYKWTDLFSAVPAAPPAYEEIFPDGDVDTKRASATRAAADAAADNKCASLFDQTQTQVETQAESSTSAQKRPVVWSTVRVGKKHTITREQQDQLRLAHAEKVKRLTRDKNLFFIWIPLLVVIILAMLINRVPQLYTRASSLFARPNDAARIVEVQ
ncbi:Protein MGA2 [Lachnellula suecica]|uniref:Protein MGA2 n=1 Tax=Lachnellula suecica TaxID=602035 RepID=A0A8T9C0M4_9HELO|nr:Protein MGA2 [Lachnellula suecica]